MTKEIIITGEFDIQGVNTNNFKKPLSYLRLRIGYPVSVIVEEMSSSEKKEDSDDN